MPGGVPHWVLTISNAICIGRHFYSKSTIRSSVVANIHTFLLQGSLTNQDAPKTRMLLYQLMVFWSLRLDKTNIDGLFNFQTIHYNSNVATIVGVHIPDLLSEVDFFDVVYLGIFIIFSPTFNPRFYNGLTPSPTDAKEAAYAVRHFCSLLNIFSQQFTIVLDGEVVSHSYVVDRMMGEFAAASVALAKGIDEEVGIEDLEAENRATSAAIRERIEDILLNSYPEVIPYYTRCLDRGHKDFLWTGPSVLIQTREDDFS